MEQVGWAVGLLDEAGEALAGEPLGGVLFAVSGGEDDADVRVEAAEFAKGFFAVHVGHGHVEQDEVDAWLSAVGLDGFVAVGGGKDGVPGLFEDPPCDVADGFVVVDDEDGVAGRGGRG